MVDIYSRANRVVIWLGDEDARSRNAMQFIQDIVQVDSLDGLVADQKTVKDWGDLMHLMQNPWFSRRSVIQEMAYAKQATVHLAEVAIPWNDLRDAVSLFVLNPDKIRALLQPLLELSTGLGHGVLLHDHLGSMDFLLRNNLNSLPAKVFIDVLDYMFRKPKNGRRPNPMHGFEFLTATLYIYQSSDPRETIHALRSIALETSTATVDSNVLTPSKPDYTLDLLEVYTGFVRWVVESTGSIDIICRHWALPERQKGATNYPAPVELPSWIRIASEGERSRRGVKSDSLVGLPGHRIYDASKSLRARVDFSPQRGENYVPFSQRGRQDDRTQATVTRPALDGDTDHSLYANGVHSENEEPSASSAEGRRNARILRNHTHLANGMLNGHIASPRLTRAVRQQRSSSDSSLDDTDLEQILIVPKSLQNREKDASISVRGILIGTLDWTTDPITDGVIDEACIYGLMDGEGIAALTGIELEERWHDFRALLNTVRLNSRHRAVKF